MEKIKNMNSAKETDLPNSDKEKSRAEQIEKILNRGIIIDVIPDIKEFKEKLLKGDKLKIYIGADPTSSSLHLSHAKNYMLLEELRKLGCEVYVLIGDFTARIGDPTDKEETRKRLTDEQVEDNIRRWKKQIAPLIDFNAKENQAKIVYNKDWLSKLTMEDVIELASNMTVQRMMERDMFEKRLKENRPIYLHEFIYPLMQGYDSVALNVDAELCGKDQTFNALVGKTLLRRYKDKDKFVIIVNLMENPKTKGLMSKSSGTGVFLDASPENMYGQIMAQPDEMIKIMLINNTRIPLEEIDKMIQTKSPRDTKMLTAYEITKIFFGEKEAKKAEELFIKKVQNKEAPDDLDTRFYPDKSGRLFSILKECMEKNTTSSQIRRLIQQNAIKVNEKTVSNLDKIIEIPDEGLTIKVGKNKWIKVKSK